MTFSFDEEDLPEEPTEEMKIDFFCQFAGAVIEQAEKDGVLFDMITKWPPERAAMYEQAVLLYHATIIDN